MATRENKLTYDWSGVVSKSDRLKELIVYIATKCADDPAFGATKLNKILYFSDFLAYQKYGKPITGMAYQKLDFGPAPKALLPIREELEKEGAIACVKAVYCGRTQKRVLAQREAKLSFFSATDIATVDFVIECLRNANAATVSRISHNVAWKTASLKEEIPYESVFLSDTTSTEQDAAWAMALNKECGWDA